MTIQELAKEAGAFFETRKRDNGESFVRYLDDTPEWIQDMVQQAHGDYFPDDYRYRWVVSALADFADCNEDSDTEDHIIEHVDSCVDCYTSGLTEWLNSNNRRVYYLTEALDEFDPKDGFQNGFQVLSMAQYKEISEVYYSVYKVLENNIAALEIQNA